MKKKGLIFALVIVIVFSLLTFAACNNKNKNKEEEILEATTIEVSNEAELRGIANYLGKKYKNYTFKLTQDITLSEDWTPLGLSLSKAFYGTLNGNNKTITGLNVVGWDNDGKPKYIAKRVIGYIDNQPVYNSTEIIDMKTSSYDDRYERVDDITYEGDNDDPNYKKLDDEDAFENTVSYGSVGLFGYTFDSNIYDLTIKNADISFYTSGEVAYCGILSGYDVSSTFKNINVDSATIKVSTIYQQNITTYDYYGTPEKISYKSIANEYLGGLVGYATGTSSYKENGLVSNQSEFEDVAISNLVIDNTNYSAYYDANLYIDGNKDTSVLVQRANTTNSYKVFDVQNIINRGLVTPDEVYYPIVAYVGGVTGFAKDAKFKNVVTTKFNESIFENTTKNLQSPKQLMAKSLYASGISAYISEVDSNNVDVNDAYLTTIKWTNWQSETKVATVYTKAIIGGAYALAGASKIVDTTINNLFTEVGGSNSSLSSVCIGGAIGYAFDKCNINNVNVDTAYAYSSYADIESDSLGSVVAGAVGQLRDSDLTTVTASNIDIEVSGRTEKSYSFVRGIVSQVYGNSSIATCEATNVSYVTTERNVFVDFNKVNPVEYKNNYVNPDGYPDVRLYYADANNNTGKTYVSVYGDLIPKDSNNNLLHKEILYIESNDVKNVQNGEAQVGDTIAPDRYYYYDANQDRYYLITSNSTRKTFAAGVLYAEPIEVFRVEFNNPSQSLASGSYYEYNKQQGKLTLTTDTTVNTNKTYYQYVDDSIISKYNLYITLYSESGNTIVIDDKGDEDDSNDILADGVFEITKETFINAAKVANSGTYEYTLCYAEIFINTYFNVGTGFIKDMNNKTIAVQGRDFTKYVLKTGRPSIDYTTINYN